MLSRPHTSLSTNKLDVIEDAGNGDELNDDGYDTDLEIEGTFSGSNDTFPCYVNAFTSML